MQQTASGNRPSIAASFFHHLLHMPTWHRYVLLTALAIGAVGVVGRVRQFTGVDSTSASAATATPQGGGASVPHNSFGPDAPADSTGADSTTTGTNAQPWYLSPRFLGVGGSVLGGFVIGWAMRMFIRTTLLIGVVISAIIGRLSYFHVMNIDFTSVQQQYSGDLSWVSDQASRLKDVAIEHLPVHAGGIFGMFLGFRRPRM